MTENQRKTLAFTRMALNFGKTYEDDYVEYILTRFEHITPDAIEAATTHFVENAKFMPRVAEILALVQSGAVLDGSGMKPLPIVPTMSDEEYGRSLWMIDQNDLGLENDAYLEYMNIHESHFGEKYYPPMMQENDKCDRPDT